MPFKDVSIATASYMVEFFEGKPPHSFENHHREMCREKKEKERVEEREGEREGEREREREREKERQGLRERWRSIEIER